MKKLYFVSMLLGMVLATTSCDDTPNNYTDEFATVLHYKQEGFVEFDYQYVNKDITHTITIGKGGLSPESQAVATLVPFTEEEMQAYNQSSSTNYELLPPEYYAMPTTLTFAPGETYKNVDIVFKSTMGAPAKVSNYLLPVRLLANEGSANENKNLIYLKPNVLTPIVTMELTGRQNVTMSTSDSETTTFNLNFYLDMKNEWEFAVNFERNQELLEDAVEAYNTANGTNCSLLPEANRTFNSSLAFTSSESRKPLSVALSRKDLVIGDYLLPIIPTGCSGMPFDMDNDICYIHVFVTEPLPKIALTESMLSASSTVQWDGEKIKNVLDNNTATHWQSIWTSWGDITDARHDPVYGVYIDISLTTPLDKQIALQYSTRKSDGNAVPNHIVIYAGTSAGNLKQIDELKRVEDNLPIKGDTQYNSRNISLNGNHNVTLIRLAILTQYNASNGSVADLREVNFKSVTISELSFYGK